MYQAGRCCIESGPDPDLVSAENKAQAGAGSCEDHWVIW